MSGSWVVSLNSGLSHQPDARDIPWRCPPNEFLLTACRRNGRADDAPGNV